MNFVINCHAQPDAALSSADNCQGPSAEHRAADKSSLGLSVDWGTMMTEKPRDRAQLAKDYTDEGWRQKLLELLALVDALGHCIIEADFKVTDDLNRGIVLTAVGKKVRDQLITKEEVDPKVANLLCLLGLVHHEPLVDIDAIDIDRLTAPLSEYIKSGKLKFPLVFGRSLYDEASTLIAEERNVLKHEDTLRLLADKPQGVYHTGPFLIGPYGIMRTKHARNLVPRLSVPIQHCSDLSCPSVHNVRLTSSQEANVNKQRSLLYKVLHTISEDSADWNGFVVDITEKDWNPYEVDDGSTMPYLLGDAFDDEELRALVGLAVSSTGGRLAAVAASVGLAGNPAEWCAGLNRGELLQILLTETDEALTDLVDDAILGNEIVVPEGEVRRPVVNHRMRSGAWRLRPEASRLGARYSPGETTTTLLRLFSLARSMFDKNSAMDMDELAWMLRDVSGDTPTERLETFFKMRTPREIVEKLLLGRRSNAEKAAKILGLDLKGADAPLLDAIMWKLGFPMERRLDVRDEYWRHHQLLETFATTASASADSTEEDLRSIASNYFVALEKFLFDSLTFATWALLEDHVKANRPYEYRAGAARAFTIETLNASVSRKAGVEVNDLRDDPDLSSVVQGFLRLAGHLSSLRENADAHVRQLSDIPRFADQTDLQRFPFRHTAPFLDLLPASQHTLPRVIAEAGSMLNDSGIMTARNGLLHAKSKRTPTISEVNGALSMARSALRLLEEIGCVRNTFETVSVVIDAWGRSTTLLRSNGADIKFAGPSSFAMLGLPSLGAPVYLMQGAVFAEPNEMLRFREGFDSAYANYWSNFPHRPERGSGTSPGQPDQTVGELASPAPVD
ncbi:hypothetical protein RWH43_02330 [Microbacterium sp. KSW2-21]|uniref:DUF4238 domain-containing protein n=1 Tax=Microbacterium algihabitans TaxID=3075992 RepID=A0ABU3RS15_9MICO|nr:hypothetical protein [Microbacterium sp. KSW2-21]MDU0325585.1 hypothetical protein [Microbacterium sp. KSW2-21]